jgi:hypothetical protein
VRSKLDRGEVVFWQELTEEIKSQKRQTRIQAQNAPDREFRRTFHGDLDEVIRRGIAVKAEHLVTLTQCELVINGPDRDGKIVIVSIYVEEDQNFPVQIGHYTYQQP